MCIRDRRYKELSAEPSDPSDDSDAPYDLVGYLTEIDTGVIDSNYMNSRFDKYLKLLNQAGASGESIEQAKACLLYTSEQQQIGSFFQQLDHLITLHQRELEKLQNIKKSMGECKTRRSWGREYPTARLWRGEAFRNRLLSRRLPCR